MQKILKLRMPAFFLGISFLLLLSMAPVAANAANGDERYKAMPHNGGFFILDTRDGHMWVWSGRGATVTQKGTSDQILYQGNVRSNMQSKPAPVPMPTKNLLGQPRE